MNPGFYSIYGGLPKHLLVLQDSPLWKVALCLPYPTRKPHDGRHESNSSAERLPEHHSHGELNEHRARLATPKPLKSFERSDQQEQGGDGGGSKDNRGDNEERSNGRTPSTAPPDPGKATCGGNGGMMEGMAMMMAVRIIVAIILGGCLQSSIKKEWAVMMPSGEFYEWR